MRTLVLGFVLVAAAALLAAPSAEAAPVGHGFAALSPDVYVGFGYGGGCNCGPAYYPAPVYYYPPAYYYPPYYTRPYYYRPYYYPSVSVGYGYYGGYRGGYGGYYGGPRGGAHYYTGRRR
jgi:spore coat protein T